MEQNQDKTEDKKVEQDRPMSVRDAIRAAVDEHSQDNIGEEPKKKEKEEKIIDEPIEKDSKEDIREASEATEEDTIKKRTIKKDADEISETKDKVEEIEVKEKKVVPVGLPKDVKQDWPKLSSNTQEYITKSHKELSDTKAELGRRIAQSKEMDSAIAPYMGAIQQLGVTPAQTVDRLFQWMNALAGPQKYQAIQQLAQDFGIDLPSLYAQQKGDQKQKEIDPTSTVNDQQQEPYTDPRIVQAIEAMYNEVAQIKSNSQQNREQTAQQTVNSWAGLQNDGSFKHKPYFPQVRQLMFSLLSSGAIPLINGNLDLDGAYDAACYSHSEVRQLIMAEQEEKKSFEREEARKKKVAEEKAKVAKAKSLNVSLRPSSPTGDFSKDGKKPNSLSVRDSIQDAIKEVSNQ